jgi:hypothetical protein
MYNKEDWTWRQSQLKHFVLSVIREWKSRPLVLLIDALDECNEGDVRDVVGLLERLSLDALQSGVTLRICLSSRHYPHISMKKVLELTVEKNEEHRRDIATYVREKLTQPNHDIEAEIRQKADGIFMWVVIVVSLLNKAYDEGRVEAMRKVLENVPGDLEKVFNVLLSKDDQNKAETILMLQWVLLTQHSLKSEELFFATLVGTAPEYAGPWDRSKITMDTIQHRITTSSKGLIEVRKGDTTSVQFIHLSVSDFLSRNRRLQMLDQTLEPDPFSASYERLWDRCWSCIKQVNTTLTSVHHMRELKNNYPFLRYATSHIFDHADKALSGRTRYDWLGWCRAFFNPRGTFSRPEAIRQWLRKHNDLFRWWKIFVITHGISDWRSQLGGSMDAGPLYVLSLRGYQNLVRAILKEGTEVNAHGGDYDTALQAAAAMGREDIVTMLLEAGADVNAQGGDYGTALQAAIVFGREDIVTMLLNAGADVNAQGRRYGTALQAATAIGREEIVTILLEARTDVNAQDGGYGTALQAASAKGRQETARVPFEKKGISEFPGISTSLSIARLCLMVLFTLFGWLIVQFLGKRYMGFLGLRLLGA